VLNSYAETVNATNCNLLNSPHSVIGVTGDGWTVSDDSTVTNSELNNATIKDNSVVDNSTITNSTIESSEVHDALIEDGVIKNGTINFTDGSSNVFYNATLNGSKPLTEIINYAPVPVISINPGAPNTNQQVTFDASGSTDKNGDALNFTWDFGDGSSATGNTTTHTYTAAGTYTVTLIAEEDKSNGKQSNTTAQVTVTDASTTQNNNNNNRGRSGGGGGGGSRLQTATVTNAGVEMSFRPYESLRLKVNNKIYPAIINFYRLDTGKVMLLINGVRTELNEGETISVDLDRNKYPDVQITGVKLTRSLATLRFLPVGVKPSAPLMPVFNIPPRDLTQNIQGGEKKVEQKSPEPKPLLDKTVKDDVEVNAQVGGFWSKIANSFRKLFGSTSGEADVGGSQWVAMAIIAGVVLIGLGAFFVVRKLYFY